jgi:hypothetical protein
MFVNGNNNGITFTYDDVTNTMTATVTSTVGDTLSNNSHEFTLGSDGTLTLDGEPFAIPDVSNFITSEDIPAIPTNTNQLVNGAGFITLSDVPAEFSGSYDDLTNKPTIPTDVNDLTDTDGLLSGGSSNTIEYTDEETGYQSRVQLTYDFDVDVDNAHLNINGSGSWNIGSSNFETEIFSTTNDDGNDPIDIVVRANNKDWTFKRDGTLTFPDGSVQTTAYTGSEVTTGGEPLFIVVNNSGESAYSNDGETWTQVASFPDGEGSLGLDRVAVHRDFIVYISGDDDLWTAEEPGVQPTLITITSEVEGSYNWNDIQAGGNYVVAVGRFSPEVGNDVPAFAYTTDGSSWTVGSVNSEYIAFTNAREFTSVDYDSTGWFITASDYNSETAGQGAFYTTDLTSELAEAQFITFTGLDTPPSIDSVTWTGSNWFVLDDDDSIVGQRIYVSSGANPLSSTWTQYSLSSIADDYDYRLGMSDNGFYENAGGNGTFMIASGEGQILYTTNGGTIWSGLVPNAYTCTIDSVLAGSSTVITGFTMTLGGTDWDGNNFNGIEKLTITGATPSDYNGTRYVKTFGIPDNFLSRPSNNRNTNWIPGTYNVVVGEDFTVELVVDAEFYLTGSNITITGTGLYGWGHEFTISGTELGGTDVIDDIILTAYNFATAGKEYRVFTDSACTTALDSSGFATFESASAILNRGTYIDAVGYGLNKFLIGNDDEQLLTAPHDDLSVWTIVDNQNNDFEYWDDIGFNADFGGTGAVAGSYLTNGSATLVLNSDGSITFPDGSIQTTAYTGTSIGPMYVVANVDGNITYSRDGTTFSATFNTGLNQIGTVAVGPNKIVYSGHDINVDADTAGLYSTSSPTIQPTLITGTDGNGDYYLAQVQYFPTATPPWVAVGVSTQTTPKEPIILHSTDAVTWTETRVNTTDLSTFFTDDAVDLRFTDIHYAQGGWLISADRNTNSGAKGGGLWWTTDITQELTTSSNFISADANFKAIEYFDSPNLGDRWFAITNNSIWGTSDTIPSTAVNWGEWDPALFTEIILNNTNLTGLTVEEATSGVTTYDDGGEFGILDIWAMSSAAGHIVFWTDVPDGPWVSIPAPYTATIDTWSSSSTSAITYTGISFLAQGEKFTVTGSSVTDYNGTFYIGDGGSVYTDAALTTPFATNGFSSFTGTATLTWSHGKYIDALGFAGGYIYCANDDEEVYRGELTNYNTITWTKVDDKNNSLEYWNDISYYSEFEGSSGSTADTGNFTFSGDTVTNSAGMLLETGRGTLALGTNMEAPGDPAHFHIAFDGSNSSTPYNDLFLGDDYNYVKIGSYASGVQIGTNSRGDGTTQHSWQFNNDGSINLPTLTVPISDNANPSGTGQTLKFNDPTQQAIIYGPLSTTDYNSAERVIIQGAPGYTGTTGEGGDVYLWAGPGGDAGGDGGDIKVRAGRGQLTGSGGYLNFQAGQSDTGNGGYVNIESGDSNTFGSGGYITITARGGAQITLRTENSTGQSNELYLNNQGTLTLPGAVINSTVEKVGIADDVGTAMTLSDSTFANPLVDGNYGPFTLGVVTFTVVVTSGVAAYTVTATSGNSTVNDTIGTLDSGDLGGTPGSTSNISVDTVQQDRTAIDLTKSINKLTNNTSDNNYYLADGVEGQIMYLVPTPNTVVPENIKVYVNHGRNGDTQYLNAEFWPFGGNDGSQFFTGSICTLIFTDNHWQQVGGNWV